MKDLFLGIDTSNYTSSFGLIDEKGKVVEDIRIILKVKNGEKGLRQSDAVFQHITNLEEVASRLLNTTNGNIIAVAASTSPRKIAGSYMPVFVVSKNIGKLISSVLKIPFYNTTHQRGHIRNAIAFSEIDESKPFIAIHFSGGTSEILSVDYKEGIIRESIIGETLDITAGQLIDRIGVFTGLDFPCGKEMEEKSNGGCDILIDYKYYFHRGNLSYSGLETSIKNSIMNKKYSVNIMYNHIFMNIAKSLQEAINYHCLNKGYKQVLLFGGVLSNKIIKDYLKEQFRDSPIRTYFCDKEYCGDNAIGVAYIGRDYYGRKL